MGEQPEDLIELLVERWEDAYEQGIDLSIDLLCEEPGTLREVVATRIQVLKSMQHQFSFASTVTASTATSIVPPTHNQPKVVESRSRYEQLVFHAAGTAGEVFRALDVKFARTVAIKVLRQDRATGFVERAHFRWEAEVTSRLDHPVIIPVYDSGTLDDGRPFYVMRFVEGKSLEQAISDFHEQNAAIPGTAASLFRNRLLLHFIAACHAINYAHHRGIVHRDLKPSHILIGKHNETMVVDWGLARKIKREGRFKVELEESLEPSDESLSRRDDHIAAGTPAYMSPELWQGSERVLPSHDIYALGVCLFKLVMGSLPYRVDSLASFRLQMLQQTLPAPQFDRRMVSQSLESILLKSIHSDPVQRYESAGDLAADLEALLGGFPVSALTGVSHQSRWRRFLPILLRSKD